VDSTYQFYQLSNGIRLVYRQTSGPVAHFGAVINAGSRDELPHEQGIAHFIEHMVFKGTQKRNAYQVINRLENVGADMNAFTTKEETCVYASFLEQYAERAIELLNDILFFSVFSEKEMEKEKDVIIDEINSYKENPAEWIHDAFDELAFPDHQLGRNILGTPSGLKKMHRANLVDFRQRTYGTGRIVLSFVGNPSFQKICRLLDKYFGQQPELTSDLIRTAPAGYKAQTVRKKYSRHQSHLILGNLAYSYDQQKRYPMALLNNLLGGPAMNSRLNLALREKHGIAYNLESNYIPLSDTGLFSIYLGTDEKMVEKAILLVNKELNKLRSIRLGEMQIKVAREQLKGQMAISLESQQNEMISIGKSYLVYNRVDTLQDLYKKIDAIGSAALLEVANEVFDPGQMSLLVFSNR